MTIKVNYSLNLSIDNDVYNFKKDRLPSRANEALAGMCRYMIGTSRYQILLTVLNDFYNHVSKKFPEQHWFLFVGNSVWQPDTKIIRHYKLWNLLELQGIKVPDTKEKEEFFYEANNKLKYMGFIKLYENSILLVADILMQEKLSYLLVSPYAELPKDFFNKDWTGNLSEDKPLLIKNIKNGIVFIKNIGEFDDVENGIIVFGRPDLIAALHI